MVCKGSIGESMEGISIVVRIAGGFGISEAEIFGFS